MPRRVATLEPGAFRRRYATRVAAQRRLQALKRLPKFKPPLRGATGSMASSSSRKTPFCTRKIAFDLIQTSLCAVHSSFRAREIAPGVAGMASARGNHRLQGENGFYRRGNHFYKRGNGFYRTGNHFYKGGNGFYRTGNHFCNEENRFCRRGNHFCNEENWFCKRGNQFCNEGNAFCKGENHFCREGNAFCKGGNHFCKGGNRFCRVGNQFCRVENPFRFGKPGLYTEKLRLRKGKVVFARGT
jgi:hypothetical protein